MTAVDAPPGVEFAGQPAGFFVARPRARGLARGSFYIAVAAGLTTLSLATRRLHSPFIELMLLAPFVSIGIGAVGFAVRAAHLEIGGGGVRWGWRWAGFHIGPSRLRRITVYSDAVALKPRRGSTWYLSRRDWSNFDELPAVLTAAGLEFEVAEKRAPLAARLQSYGAVLDVLLVLNALGVTLTLLLAALA